MSWILLTSASIAWVLASSRMISPLDDSMHPFRRQCSSSVHWVLPRLHPFAWWSSSCQFQLDSFSRGRMGALIGLFTHGLAIKKLLAALSHYRLYGIIIRRDAVIISVCVQSGSNPSPTLLRVNHCGLLKEVMDKSLVPSSIYYLY